ncbi:MAG: cysteine--tRNA ligase [Gemmatimonadaceae bacterium]
MADLRLYNSLSKQVEPFAPADGKRVRLYTCGPTVYNPAHLGNFRTFLVEDLLRRTLRLAGFGVEQVMNLTDVDDKIIRKAAAEGKTIREITEPVIEVFHRDREYLGIERAEHYPRATHFIAPMIALVQRLVDKGVAYLADDGSVYFAIARFPSYGRLSRLDTRELKPGARVAQDDYSKDNAQDFALWKAAKGEDEAAGAAWDSPWGRGRPGWHLECSAMAMELLGPTIDVHCGGIDLVFPHHEDEIAQSEAATGQPFARVWCHGEFLLTDGAKMAKRVGNVQTVDGLRSLGISGAAFRYVVYTTHYRQQLHLSTVALDGAVTAVGRLEALDRRLRDAVGATVQLQAAADEAERSVRSALFDDLNAPRALAALNVFVTRANAALDGSRGAPAEIASALEGTRRAFQRINDALGLLSGGPAAGGTPDGARAPLEEDLQRLGVPEGEWAVVRDLVAQRGDARARRDFARADAIRADLAERRLAVRDTPAGPRLDRV